MDTIRPNENNRTRSVGQIARPLRSATLADGIQPEATTLVSSRGKRGASPHGAELTEPATQGVTEQQ